MTGTAVTVADMLRARDLRAQRQRQLLEKYSLPLVSFTMNIPGEIKRLPRADLAFLDGCERLVSLLGEPEEKLISLENTGTEALFVFDRDAQELKNLCMQLEGTPVGRLYDLDVIGAGGVKLSRAKPRRCLVCGNNAALCARSRAHGLSAVCAAVDDILAQYTAQRLAELAVSALREEALLTPKPGLVDAHDSGAHSDMDCALLLKSADTLRPYFLAAARAGAQSDDCMPRLVAAGIEAERLMLDATGGVNTHKGAIYALGLLTAALAACGARGGDPFMRASALAAAGSNTEPGSHGEAVRRRHSGAGARAEAENGFPCVKAALTELDGGGDALSALLRVILVCEDSNLLHRGGEQALSYARQWAAHALELREEERRIYLEKINAEMTARSLSPGGCADMLAAALLMRSAQVLYR